MNLHKQLSLFDAPPPPPPPAKPSPDRRGIFQRGDRVEILRKGMLYGKLAKIKEFKGTDAIVEAPDWRINPQFPLSELRLYRGPIEF